MEEMRSPNQKPETGFLAETRFLHLPTRLSRLAVSLNIRAVNRLMLGHWEPEL